MNRILKFINILILAISLAACGKSVEAQIAEQLELGQKYLLEMNYESAVVAFDKVIALDPKRWEAYEGSSKAYMAQENLDKAIEYLENGQKNIEVIPETGVAYMAETYLTVSDFYKEQGDIASAVSYLEKVVQLQPDNEEVKQRLENYREELEEQKEKERIEEEFSRYIDELKTMVEEILTEEDYNFEESLLLRDDFQKLLGSVKDKITIELENGKFVGLYEGGYFYYGDMVDGIRQGYGVWMNYEEDRVNIFEGEWKNDYPNGKGIEKTHVLHPVGSNAVRYEVVSGTFVDGYYDGVVIDTFYESDGGVSTFNVIFSKGIPEILDVRPEVIENPYVIGYAEEDHDSLFVWDGTYQLRVFGIGD